MIDGYDSNIPNNIEFDKTDCADFEEMKKSQRTCIVSLYTYDVFF